MNSPLQDKTLQKLLLQASFGLEKESLRITPQAQLSKTRHPFVGDNHIDRDFCESQVEFITDVFSSPAEVCHDLYTLHQRAYAIMQPLEEVFWPFSNPPYVGEEDDILIAQYTGELREKQAYREYLAKKYDKRKMLHSGIHFNFNFSKETLQYLHAKESGTDFITFQNNFYLSLAAKIMTYDWLIVYLTAASPIVNGSFYQNGTSEKDIVTAYASVRCGEHGYWNDFVPILDYTSLEGYRQSIQAYLDAGVLRATSELYYPVRVKALGDNTLENLRKRGINHVELRMLDLNPFSPIGVVQEDLTFLHYFLLYLAAQEEIPFGKAEQEIAIANAKNGAMLDDATTILVQNGKRLSLKIAANQVLAEMEAFFLSWGVQEILDAIHYQQAKLTNPSLRYANRVIETFDSHYIQKGMALAKQYALALTEEQYVPTFRNQLQR